MGAWQDNISFVLVEPKEPGNIGASARAIKNMGFRNLCLVNPPPEMTHEGKWFARNAHDVLDAAAIYMSIAEAIKNKAIVVGTTRRGGKRRGVIMSPDDGASEIKKMAINNRVAILFGRETRGLYNEEVEECGFLLKIPSSKLHPSLNLSHAVMIIAYELFLAGYGGLEERNGRCAHVISPDSHAAPTLETHREISCLYERISGALELLEYIPRGDRNIKKKIIVNLKHFIGRAGLTHWELKMLQGLCYQIEKKVGRS